MLHQPARFARSVGVALSRRALVLGAAIGLWSLPLDAQQATVDEGTLIVSRRGALASRESFRIQHSPESGRLYVATAQIALGDRRITPSLSADGQGNALLYRVEVRQGGQLAERLQASARTGRISAVRHTPQGEASKEYVVGGGAVVLDEDVYHQYVLLALARRRGPVTVVVPRAGAQQPATLAERGSESITVDGQQVAATRWSLALPDGPRDFWTDARGRLLKVEIPALGIVAVRDELAR